MKLTGMHHVSILVPDMDASVAWYTSVLGLKEVKRPSNFVTPVRWFDLGDEQIHLIPSDEPDAISPRHFAIHVDDVKAAREVLRGRGVEVRETVPIAGAVLDGVAGVAARARVHGAHKDAARRIGERGGGAGDGDVPLLQRLTHHLQHLPIELRQLVQEQDAVVREAHFPRTRDAAAADEAGVAPGRAVR